MAAVYGGRRHQTLAVLSLLGVHAVRIYCPQFP